MVRYAKPALLDAVPASHCVIEASAGTGKTFTLEHLVVQLILDGVPLESILVVTFTRKATLELIARVREKLAELADLAPRTIQKIEAGQLDILATTIRRLQKTLRCGYDDLLG